MPFGSRRFFTGRSINPAVTTIGFNRPFGVGSTTPQNMASASISGDTAGNTLNGNGTYNSSDTLDLGAGTVGNDNRPICVPLTEQRNYIMRIKRVGTTIDGTGSSSPHLGTTNATASGTGIFSSTPIITIKYGRIRYVDAIEQDTTSLLALANHDTSADATVNVSSGVYTHYVDFSNTVTGATYTFQTDFNVAENDNDPSTSGSFTAKGIFITHAVQNTGSGAGGQITIELQQA